MTLHRSESEAQIFDLTTQKASRVNLNFAKSQFHKRKASNISMTQKKADQSHK